MRNIHFKGFQPGDDVSSVYDDEPSPAAAPAPAPAIAAEVRLKLREVAVSPDEEYALRPGQVQPISDSLAALILWRGGRVTVGLKGVVADLKGKRGKCTFWHPDSIVCSDLSYRSRKVFYVWNKHRPEVLHLLDDSGNYIESLPARDCPAVLDNAAQEKEARAQNRAIRRANEHLQEIHGPDTKKAIAELRHNAKESRRMVQTLPVPGSAAATPVQAARSELGDTIAAAERDVMAGRQNYDRTPMPADPRKTAARPAAARHTEDLTETASEILSRRGRSEVDCPY